MILRRFLSTSSLALGLALALAGPGIADEVVLIPNSSVKNAAGGRVRGTIESETPNEVVVKLGATSTTVPTSEVVSIVYQGAPASMTLAESRESAGALQEAADLYKKASGETDKPFIKQATLFAQANAMAELAMSDASKSGEAVTLLQSFVQTYGSGRHIIAALDSLARLQLEKGDFSAVEKTLTEMSKHSQSKDRAAVLRAKVSAKQGNFDKALAEYDTLIKNSPADSFRQRQARLAKAESLAGLKKYKEAEAEVRSVIAATPPEDFQTQSAAYNTLGDCLEAAGHPKEALDAYLHTDILYSKDREQHPRALAHIAKLWRLLKREDRADEILQQLKKDYTNSRWVSVATATSAQ